MKCKLWLIEDANAWVQVVDDPDDDKMLMVMEYVNGGALMDGSNNATTMNPLSESLARKHFRDVLKVHNVVCPHSINSI